MPYNFVADSFHSKKLCGRLSFKQNAILVGKQPFSIFEPSFVGLEAECDVHLRLIVDFFNQSINQSINRGFI